jgi:hypothetical protein
VEQPTPQQIERKYWQKGAEFAVLDALCQRVNAGLMTLRDYDRTGKDVVWAQIEQRDEALIHYLATYCPHDPHLTSYPHER